jgi:hypothetical protein
LDLSRKLNSCRVDGKYGGKWQRICARTIAVRLSLCLTTYRRKRELGKRGGRERERERERERRGRERERERE